MIHPNLMTALARDRVQDLRRGARHRLPEQALFQPQRADESESAITLRLAASAQDDDLLARLAAVDDSAVPAPPILLAVVDGEVRAGLSLTDRTVIADPFHHTTHLVDLLRARARQLQRPSRIERLRGPRSVAALGAQLSAHR
jgi:hypothetical protein